LVKDKPQGFGIQGKILLFKVDHTCIQSIVFSGFVLNLDTVEFLVLTVCIPIRVTECLTVDLFRTTAPM